jgi:flagellar basal-body rod protein FlgG
MMRSLYTAATGMDAQQTKMDTIANNLANANTTGFKKSRADFEDLLSETLRTPSAPQPQGGTSPVPLQVGLGVRTSGTSRSFTQGDYSQTDNPLDLAIQGDGLFRVTQPNGEYAYTRAGNFKVDAEGRLVTQRGELIEPQIVIPKDTTSIAISEQGVVSVETATTQGKPTELGQLELCTFVNPAGLSAIGGNLFIETAASGGAMIGRPGEQGSGTILQSALESSNVKAVEEMVAMISTQRSYELNSKVIQTADQMLQKLSNLR